MVPRFNGGRPSACRRDITNSKPKKLFQKKSPFCQSYLKIVVKFGTSFLGGKNLQQNFHLRDLNVNCCTHKCSTASLVVVVVVRMMIVPKLVFPLEASHKISVT